MHVPVQAPGGICSEAAWPFPSRTCRASVKQWLSRRPSFLTLRLLYIMIYSRKGRVMAEARKTRVFMSGRSQAVRIPAEFRFDTDEVYVRRDHQTGDLILSRSPS